MTDWEVLRAKVKALDEYMRDMAIFMIGINEHILPTGLMPAHLLKAFDDIEGQLVSARNLTIDLQEVILCAEFYNEILSFVERIDPYTKRQAIDAYDAKRSLKGDD